MNTAYSNSVHETRLVTIGDRMKIRTLGMIALIMAILSVGVPYTILGDIGRIWASYLYWTILTVLTIVIGFIHLRGWDDKR